MMKNSKTSIILALCIGLALIFFSSDIDAQCAMCKASIESSVKDGQPSPGAGINEGILYIMGIPYLLIAATGFFIYKHNKRLKLEDK